MPDKKKNLLLEVRFRSLHLGSNDPLIIDQDSTEQDTTDIES